jgi:5'-3' exonuclease
MMAGTLVSWRAPGLSGETIRVVTTSPIQLIQTTAGESVECVTLACFRFVPVSQLVVGHDEKPPQKTKAPAGSERDEPKAKPVSATKVPGDRETMAKAAAEHGIDQNAHRDAGPLRNVRSGSDSSTTGQPIPGRSELASGSGYGKRVEVLAVDFLNLLVRAYHTGTKTDNHAVRSMFQTVAGAIRELNPAAVVFALDGGHDHRTALLPEYKAHRPEPEPLLQKQKALAEQAIAAAGFQAIRVQGFEADDVLASIARQRPGVVICSSDKDLLALGGVARVYHPWGGGSFVTSEERLLLPPGQVTDFLALCGDTSDGIPGVKGIGPKTAAELLKQFGDLENILAAATSGRIPGATGKKLKEQRAAALTCRQVVELRDALKLPELHGWRPPSDWRTRLQSLGLRNVEAIVSSLTPHLTNTPNSEAKPVLSAEPEQSEQNGRDEFRQDPTELQPVQPSRSVPPEFRPSADPVVPVDAAGRTGSSVPSGESAGFVTRSITEPIRKGLTEAERFHGPDRGLILQWEAGRNCAGRPAVNPWRRDTLFAIAWQQGFEGVDLSCPVAATPEPPAAKVQPAAKAKPEPPQHKKAGSLF